MKTYLAVRRARGPAWNAALPMRGQADWDAHAAFMNALAAEGFILLGGPLGSGDTLLIFNSTDEDDVRGRLAADPWTKSGVLEIASVEPWAILLEGGKA